MEDRTVNPELAEPELMRFGALSSEAPATGSLLPDQTERCGLFLLSR